MSFLIAPLLSFGASLLGNSLKGAKSGTRKVKKPREIIVIHEGELVAPRKLANKIRRDPKYKKDIAKLPTSPAPLTKLDKKFVRFGSKL